MKQVQKEHYAFPSYLPKYRWASYWHQLDEVLRQKPINVLEIGIGAGVFHTAARHFGLTVETVDMDPELRPDHVASALALPFAEASFDVVCAFQMLEHLPYEQSLRAFGEMARVARRAVILSLPDARGTWRYHVHIPGFGPFRCSTPRLFHRPTEHRFDGQHYWECNKKGYALKKVQEDFGRVLPLQKTYTVEEYPYHRFFVFAKSESGNL